MAGGVGDLKILPREIRDQIYHNCLVREDSNETSYYTLIITGRFEIRLRIAAALASKQLRDELVETIFDASLHHNTDLCHIHLGLNPFSCDTMTMPKRLPKLPDIITRLYVHFRATLHPQPNPSGFPTSHEIWRISLQNVQQLIKTMAPEITALVLEVDIDNFDDLNISIIEACNFVTRIFQALPNIQKWAIWIPRHGLESMLYHERGGRDSRGRSYSQIARRMHQRIINVLCLMEDLQAVEGASKRRKKREILEQAYEIQEAFSSD